MQGILSIVKTFPRPFMWISGASMRVKRSEPAARRMTDDIDRGFPFGIGSWRVISS